MVADEVATRAAEVLPDKKRGDRDVLLQRVLPRQRHVADLISRAGYTNVRSYRRAYRTGSTPACPPRRRPRPNGCMPPGRATPRARREHEIR